MKNTLTLLLAALALPYSFPCASAENYPDHPIRMLVGFPPGDID